MPQNVEMDIIILDQFLDVAVHEKRGAERLRGFIRAQVAFPIINTVDFWEDTVFLRLIFIHLLIHLFTTSRSYALFIFF